MEIKIIHTADIHIGMEFKRASFGRELARKRRNEIKETFYNIVDRAGEMKVDLLLISGDLFEEEYISIGELKEINSKFNKIKDTKVVIIAGNHDPIINRKSNYQLIDWSNNVYIMNTSFDKLTIDTLNVDIYGLSWNKKEIKQYLFDNIQVEDKTKINILLAHGDIYTESNYLPIDKSKLITKGFDYVALGHIHKHDFVDKNIAYPGSPEPLDFSETGKHGILEGIVSKNKTEIHFIPFSKREFIINEIFIDEEMTIEEIIDAIITKLGNDTGSSHLYRIILKGMRDKDINFDFEYMQDRAQQVVDYVEIYDETIPNYNLDTLKKENEGNVIGQFIEYMEEQDIEEPVIKDALYEGIEALLSEKVN